MRIVALDYGSKRIGVAVSDPLGLIAQPVATLDTDQAIPQLQALLAKYDRIDEIVVGLPKRLSGELGPAADKVQAFVAQLQQTLTVPVTTYDERLTTAAAERTLIEAGLSRQKRRQVIDRSAAAHILQDYLDRRKK
ncbi:MAG: Holliday junction resolvase RuvX [Candidatus Margulisbacteria bacterium]|jgi:putative Holliday junction resolvase|nr:Holliday junction resolvase RuvX [Candidatus Margulisiibacteriota bacterium]